MGTQAFKRKLTAILSADVKGYSRLMEEDEEATVRTLTAYREAMANLIEKHWGRVVDSPGDNLLAEFRSVVDGVRCAVEIQEEFKSRNAALPKSRRMEFRIGINLGDVIEEGERIYGEGVNIAARVEGLAEGGGICISGSTHEQVRNKLALGYDYLGEHTVKNIKEPVRVYRVLMEPEAGPEVSREKAAQPRGWRWARLTGVGVVIIAAGALAVWKFTLRPSPPPVEVASEERMAFPLPDRPSIAVLPFENLSGDPEQEYFADGFTEDIITTLSKISGMFVIARNSTFVYKGKPVKVQQVSEDLGVRYVLEGSVQKSGDRLRITAQLVDATTGHHEWAERYDRKLEDIFALQDELTQRIAAALEVKVEEVETERVMRKETANLNAYDYVLRGWWYYQRFTKEANDQARLMFERAIDLEPRFAAAYAGLGLTYYEEWAEQWSQDIQSLERASELARRALALDDSQEDAHTLLSHVYLWKKQYEQAIAEQERAIALAPNDPNGYADLGETLMWAGRPEEALGLVEKAMRLNPHYPAGYLFTLGFAYFSLERYEEAIAAQKRAISRNPDHLGAHAVLAASYSLLGREEEARAALAEALRVNPQLSEEVARQRLPFKDQVLLERFLEALRKAGAK